MKRIASYQVHEADFEKLSKSLFFDVNRPVGLQNKVHWDARYYLRKRIGWGVVREYTRAPSHGRRLVNDLTMSPTFRGLEWETSTCYTKLWLKMYHSTLAHN